MALDGLPANDGSPGAVGEPLPCEQSEVIPIFPVRYALGSFDASEKALDYPALGALMDAQKSGETHLNGLTTRLLTEGWVFIHVEAEAAATEPDASIAQPSLDGEWHVFKHELLGEDGADGWKFIKYEWTGGTAGSGEWRPYGVEGKDGGATGRPLPRDFVFVPCKTDRISIAFSPIRWSLHMFRVIMADKARRQKHMQEVRTYPSSVGEMQAPLQTIGGSRPTREQLREAGPDAAAFTPAHIVAELDQGRDSDIRLDHLGLSADLYRPHTDAEIGRIRAAMASRREIGTLVALHDPLGIARDLGSLHLAAATEALHDIQSNTYAYTTFQAIEAMLAPVLPDSKHPYAVRTREAQTLVDRFKPVAGFVGPGPSPEYLAQMAAERAGVGDAYRDALAELSRTRSERARLTEAMAGLDPEFFRFRAEIAAKTEQRDAAIEAILKNCRAWLEKTGPGTIQTYMELLGEPDQGDVDDQITLAEMALNAGAQMLHGLATSRPGRILIHETVFDRESPYWRVILFNVAEKSVGWGEKISARMSDVGAQGRALRTAVDNFADAASAPLIQMAVDELVVASTAPAMASTVMGEAMAIAIQAEIADADTAIAKINVLITRLGANKEVSIGARSVSLNELLGLARGVQDWDQSVNASLLGAAGELRTYKLTFGGMDMDLDKALEKFGGGLALLGVGIDQVMRAQAVKSSVSARTTGSAAMAGMIYESAAYQTALALDALSKVIGQRGRDAAIQMAGKTARAAGVNTAVINQRLARLAARATESGRAAQLAMRLGKQLVKLGNIVAVADVAINTFKTFDYLSKGDEDAAAYAATGAVGGVVLLLAVVPGVNFLAMTTIGLTLIVVSVVGMFYSQDDRLTTWVKTGFWGAQPVKSILGFDGSANYQYWDGSGRSSIVVTLPDGRDVEKFEGQLALAGLLDDAQSVIGNRLGVTQRRMQDFYAWEMSEFHNIAYEPRFQLSGGVVSAFLPGFKPGKSELKAELRQTIGVTRGQGPGRQATINKARIDLDRGGSGWTTQADGRCSIQAPPGQGGRSWDGITYTYYPNGADGSAVITVPTIYEQAGGQPVTSRYHKF